MPAITSTTRPRATNGADPVTARVAQLRESSAADPVGARDETWAWFRDAGDSLSSDRDGALEELTTLFRAGTPATAVVGETEGMLVGWTANPIFDRAMGTLTDAWLPWVGKRFDAANQTGDNVLVGSAKWPARILWPRYSARTYGGRLTAFDFVTRVERGVLDPELDVLVIDYASVDSNPRLAIKQIRDELVEVVPGANLGKMILEGPGDRHTLLAYFALRSDVS